MSQAPSPGASGGAVYICTYSVPQSSFLHLASIAQAREGERPCQSGPNPAPECSTPPCHPGCWSLCVPSSRDPGGQRAESRSWVCLILLIGFNFSFALFSSGPRGSPGLGKRADLSSYFHTFPVQRGRGSPPSPSPSTPTRLLGECLHVSFAVVGDCLTEPHPHLGLQG